MVRNAVFLQIFTKSLPVFHILRIILLRIEYGESLFCLFNLFEDTFERIRGVLGEFSLIGELGDFGI